MSGRSPDQDILECPSRVGGTPKTHLVPCVLSPSQSGGATKHILSRNSLLRISNSDFVICMCGGLNFPSGGFSEGALSCFSPEVRNARKKNRLDGRYFLSSKSSKKGQDMFCITATRWQQYKTPGQGAAPTPRYPDSVLSFVGERRYFLTSVSHSNAMREPSSSPSEISSPITMSASVS